VKFAAIRGPLASSAALCLATLLTLSLPGGVAHGFQTLTDAVEVFYHAGPEALVKEFVVTWLRAHGIRTPS